MYECKDSSRLVDQVKEPRRYDNQYEFAGQQTYTQNYKAGLTERCCHLGDHAALRCIIVWMCTLAVVVFVALVAEIVNQEFVVQVGDVITDDPSCTKIGTWVLSQGGNAVDAAVAAAFCMTVVHPHVASLGGGGLLLMHQTRVNKSTLIDFREVSPFSLDPKRISSGPSSLSREDFIATPGLLKGLAYTRQKYGSHEVRIDCCNWYNLVQPTIKLLDEGVPIPATWKHLVDSLNKTSISQDMQRFIQQGGYLRHESFFSKKMRRVLQHIGEDPDAIYTGSLSSSTVSNLKGRLSQADLSSYEAVERSPLVARMSKYQVLTSPPPFSGAGVLAMLNSFTLPNSSPDDVDKLNNIIDRVMEEVEKLGDPLQDDRKSNQTDTTATSNTDGRGQPPEQNDQLQDDTGGDTFTVEDMLQTIVDKENAERWMSSRRKYGPQTYSGNGLVDGTSIVVMDNKDNYVSLVLSLGSSFGSQVFNQGILMNNALASFQVDNDESERVGKNYVTEGIRPLSYLSPAILIDREKTCGTRLVLGSPSPEATAQVVKPVLVSDNTDIRNLVLEPRLVHRNHQISGEQKFPRINGVHPSEFAGYPVNILEKTQNKVNGVADFRSGPVEGRWMNLAQKLRM